MLMVHEIIKRRDSQSNTIQHYATHPRQFFSKKKTATTGSQEEWVPDLFFVTLCTQTLLINTQCRIICCFASYIVGEKYIGYQLEDEVEHLGNILRQSTTEHWYNM